MYNKIDEKIAIEMRIGGKTQEKIAEYFKVTKQAISFLFCKYPYLKKYNKSNKKYFCPPGFRSCYKCKRILEEDKFYTKKEKGGHRCISCEKDVQRLISRKKYRHEYKKGGRYYKHQLARATLNAAINKGLIKRGECIFKDRFCLGKIEGHHEDYEKPLNVIWMCSKHHHKYEKSSFGRKTV